MQRTLIQIFLIGLLSMPAAAQVRAPNQMFTEIDLLFDILSAVVNRIDVDDPEILAETFPNRRFEDFDRDRDGAFMTLGSALGLYDLNLAIEQFNHDQVDVDGDGVPGFYELECAYSAFGRQLDQSNGPPTMAAMTPLLIAMGTAHPIAMSWLPVQIHWTQMSSPEAISN